MYYNARGETAAGVSEEEEECNCWCQLSSFLVPTPQLPLLRLLLAPGIFEPHKKTERDKKEKPLPSSW